MNYIEPNSPALMLTFYPGPAKVYPEVRNWLLEAYDCGILSQNHRSSVFEQMLAQTVRAWKTKLQIPDRYSFFLVSSATEAWEIIAQNMASNGSVHFWNGDFGKKWAEATQKITQKVENQSFEINALLEAKENLGEKTICLTQNETSNGTQVSNEVIGGFRTRNPQSLIAVDATSSMAGVVLDWEKADCWFASVQKCFGLPSGLAVLVCSERLMEKVNQEKNTTHYNSLFQIGQNMTKFQTTHTPNILGIYLMNRLAQNIPIINETAKKIHEQAKNWYSFFEKETDLELLVSNSQVRSDTVIVLKGSEKWVQETLQSAEKQRIVLGKGYGVWKNTSLRIANFPAIEAWEIEKLKTFFQNKTLRVSKSARF